MAPADALRLLLAGLLLVGLAAASALRSMESEEAAEAMERLLRVFGLKQPGKRERHQSPPQYMLDLYNSIADSQSGITKTVNPYDANVVRSFPNKDSAMDHMHFIFNISGVQETENILEAEFHLYKLRPRSAAANKIRPSDSRSHLLEMRVYQILDEDKINQEEGNRLLDARRISIHSTGWEVFHVKAAVLDWIKNNRPNLGLLVTLRTMNGELLQDNFLRVAKRHHHNNKQPILVLFTDDGRPKHTTLFPSEDDSGLEEYADSQELLSSNDISETTLSHETSSLSNTTGESGHSQRLRRSNDHHNHRTECTRHDLYVDFVKIGWSSWIISPEGYNAYYCKGKCMFPLGQNQRPTNHATVQSIVHELGLHEGIQSPCCVPNKLYSISLLYYDDHANVILKQYDDMVAASCGCH